MKNHFEPCSIWISWGLFSLLYNLCIFFLELPILAYQLEIAFNSMPQIPEYQSLGYYASPWSLRRVSKANEENPWYHQCSELLLSLCSAIHMWAFILLGSIANWMFHYQIFIRFPHRKKNKDMRRRDNTRIRN